MSVRKVTIAQFQAELMAQGVSSSRHLAVVCPCAEQFKAWLISSAPVLVLPRVRWIASSGFPVSADGPARLHRVRKKMASHAIGPLGDCSKPTSWP